MKNKLSDLNSYLFYCLDALSNDDLKGEELKNEINRSTAIAGVAREIVRNGSLMLNAVKVKNEYALIDEDVPDILTIEEQK